MGRASTILAGLLVSSALGTMFIGQAAMAQTAAQQNAASAAQGGSDLLADVVVTATRQADTVSRVPLSVTAVSQKTLDQEGIKTVSDLQSTVPALQIAGPPGNVQITIRGISSSQGTPTTGIYLNDTPLQKRFVNGTSTNSNNGSPVPPLFDVERVEVLRGPQGTLYGGSSEGGTIRFITPQPSLTRYSGYARAETSAINDGGQSYEAGVAVGGPIVKDKLGFHASIYSRHAAGWIDYLDPYKGGALRYENGNTTVSNAYQAALTWAPVEQGRITLNYYSSYVAAADQNAGAYVLPTSQPIVVNTSCYKVAPSPLGTPGGAVGGVVTGNPSPVSCATTAGITYTRPGASLGPFTYAGPYKSFDRELSPSNTFTFLPSLVAEYDFPKMSVKSVTSYIRDFTKALTLNQAQWTRVTLQASYLGVNIPAGIALNWLDPDYAGKIRSENQRTGLTEEIRFSSAGDSKPFSWVGGLFFSDIRGKSYYDGFEDPTRIAMAAYGETTYQRFGLGATPGGSTSNRYQTLYDNEVAAFGEGNYWITDKIKLTAGLRWSRVQFKYHQEIWGTINGSLDPRLVTGGITDGQVTESPLTPKVALQYQVTDNDTVYVSASKGYRPGGVNTPLSATICGPRVAQLGLTLDGLPVTYNSDTVWSYEGGAKLRLLENRLQLNTSVFRIAWNGVQLPVTLGGGCGQTFTINAGTARSQGFDVEAQMRLVRGLVGGITFGYTNAKYTQTATLGTGATAPVIAVGGQKFTLPPWSIDVSLRYDFEFGGHKVYIRGDDRYSASYTRNYAGTTGYSPEAQKGAPINIATARAGVEIHGFDVNVFMNNIGNFHHGNISGGRSGCTVVGSDACGSYTNYNPILTENAPPPREIGIQASYRY